MWGQSEKWVARVPIQAHNIISLKRKNSSKLRPEWERSAPPVDIVSANGSHGKRFARFHAATRQSSCLRGTVMAHSDCRRAIIFRPKLRAASSRITLYFESNHILLRLEPHSASTRTTVRPVSQGAAKRVQRRQDKAALTVREHRDGGQEGLVPCHDGCSRAMKYLPGDVFSWVKTMESQK